MNTGTRKYEMVRKFIRDHWQIMTDDQMAGLLGMNTAAVRKIRTRMGLKRATGVKKL